MKKQALTFEQSEKAIDAGKLEMKRPWGDWVSVRRRGTKKRPDRIFVFMENEVEAEIYANYAKHGFPGVRIAA